MLIICKLLKGILKFFTNITVITQIILLISMFLLAAYTLFGMIGLHMFDFAAPLFGAVRLLLSKAAFLPVDINNHAGSVVFFVCTFMIFLVYILSKFKKFLDACFVELRDLQYKCELKKENKLNEELHYETNRQIMQYNSAALLIKLTAKDLSIDSYYLNNCSFDDFEKAKNLKEQEIFKELYKQLSYVKECSFSKAGNNLLINLKDLDKIDKVLNYLDLTLKKISHSLKKEHWKMTFYIAVDAYNDKYPLKSCYPSLQQLVNLKISDSIVCFENFCNRYYKVENGLYEAFLKGSYMLPEDRNVWTLVKKS